MHRLRYIATGGHVSDDPLLTEIEGGVARLTLNRPARLNALTRETMLRLGASLREAVEREDVRVIVLGGAGRAFCAGQDLSERDPRKLEGPLDLAAIQRELHHPILTLIAEAPKPVVARVQGVAAGAGAGLALAADIVVAADDARFAFSFAKIGLAVDAGLGRVLARALGPKRAKALLMLGETLSAAHAEAAGLVWRTASEAELPTVVDALVSRLVEAPRAALSGVKKAVAASSEPLATYLEVEATAQGAAGAAPDYVEGVLAFLEKRPPRFG